MPPHARSLSLSLSRLLSWFGCVTLSIEEPIDFLPRKKRQTMSKSIFDDIGSSSSGDDASDADKASMSESGDVDTNGKASTHVVESVDNGCSSDVVVSCSSSGSMDHKQRRRRRSCSRTVKYDQSSSENSDNNHRRSMSLTADTVTVTRLSPPLVSDVAMTTTTVGGFDHSRIAGVKPEAKLPRTVKKVVHKVPVFDIKTVWIGPLGSQDHVGIITGRLQKAYPGQIRKWVSSCVYTHSFCVVTFESAQTARSVLEAKSTYDVFNYEVDIRIPHKVDFTQKVSAISFKYIDVCSEMCDGQKKPLRAYDIYARLLEQRIDVESIHLVYAVKQVHKRRRYFSLVMQSVADAHTLLQRPCRELPREKAGYEARVMNVCKKRARLLTKLDKMKRDQANPRREKSHSRRIRSRSRSRERSRTGRNGNQQNVNRGNFRNENTDRNRRPRHKNNFNKNNFNKNNFNKNNFNKNNFNKNKNKNNFKKSNSTKNGGDDNDKMREDARVRALVMDVLREQNSLNVTPYNPHQHQHQQNAAQYEAYAEGYYQPTTLMHHQFAQQTSHVGAAEFQTESFRQMTSSAQNNAQSSNDTFYGQQ
jgi:hypothetical protein